MTNPADCWARAYPDCPFGDLPFDIQETDTAAYWLGVAEAV